MSITTVNIDASAYVKKTELPSNLVLYPTTVASAIPSYNLLVTSPSDSAFDSVAVDIPTPPISGSDILVANLATTAGVLSGNPGLVNLSTIGNVRRVSGTSDAYFYYKMFHRDSLGVETLIATSSNSALVSLSIYAQFNAQAELNNGDWSASDIIVLKYYGTKSGGGTASVFQFQFGGANPVRTIVPVPASVTLDYQINFGTTAERPLTSRIGFHYFDTTISKPIWWSGIAWVDATGVTV